ncbi:MAG: UDP-3-O-(3-hydroxymyristoyl)glucosamine N-acyltransferase [Gemmatimonadetes bacterium]|nr:UDP-3-O-(3-hydroxymyristoyl)glucosamine N-acyltransferase [Gemmatimonadota bacterium]
MTAPAGHADTAVVGGDGQAPLTAAAVAAHVGGRLIGDGAVVVTGIAPLDRAGPSDLSFLAHSRYQGWFTGTRAGVVLVGPGFEQAEGASGATRVVVEKPVDAMVSLLARFHRPVARSGAVHPTAVVSPSARLGRGVSVDANAVVGDDVEIGEGSWIGAGVSIGAGSRVGRDVQLFPNAVVYPWCELGDRVVLHAGAQVGREGFGFVPQGGRAVRIPHIGRCVLEHDVELGANSCIDRGSVDDTIIGAGTKIDSLVHIAHNVRVGRGCFMAALVGIAGSTRIGDGVQIGGQVGIKGHLTIGAGATIAAQAGVFGDVPAGETWSGYPARPHKEQLRAQAALARLARVARPLEQLVSPATEPGA